MTEVLGKTCIDGGKCHHYCHKRIDGRCFRRDFCSPFSDYNGPWAYPEVEAIEMPGCAPHVISSKCPDCNGIGVIRTGSGEEHGVSTCPKCVLDYSIYARNMDAYADRMEKQILLMINTQNTENIEEEKVELTDEMRGWPSRVRGEG